MTPQKPPAPPRTIPKSLLLLRRRVLEEMHRPIGPGKRPMFETDTQLARFLGVRPSHMSHFLRATEVENVRGVSWKVVDRLAVLFNLEIWELFYVAEDYKWRTK